MRGLGYQMLEEPGRGGVDNSFHHPEWTRQQGRKQHSRQRRLIQWLLLIATSFYW